MNNPEFIPIERYPHRCALDIVDNIMKYIKDKVVCDIGCGAGDLLEYMKLRNLCKEVKGIEIDPNRYVKDREYIKFGDALQGFPDADVYLMWLTDDFPYEDIFKQIKEEKIIIYMDGFEPHHEKLQKRINILSLIESINYKYDEEKFVPTNEFADWKQNLMEMIRWRKANYPTHPNNWDPIGERMFKIYKYNP